MKRKDLEVYFIMGTQNVLDKEPLQVLEEALQAGVTIFQFREKGEGSLQGEAYERFAAECQKLCQKYRVPFIINDDIELAVKLQADGVHIGQEDMSVAEVREIIGDRILGVSVHNMDELQIALTHKVDYVGIGPIFSTKSKKDAKAPAGTSFLQQASQRYPELPIVAIGGITEQNAREPISAGADGVAIISAICESENIQDTVAIFKELTKYSI